MRDEVLGYIKIMVDGDTYIENYAAQKMKCLHLRYTNADLKTYHYRRLHMKTMCRRFHITTPLTF